MDQNRSNAAENANAADHIAGAQPARGRARGLALVTMSCHGQFHLGVKTDKGILDAPEAAKLLGVRAPGTIDDLLQNEDGPRLNALVDAALKSNAATAAFLKEEDVQ